MELELNWKNGIDPNHGKWQSRENTGKYGYLSYHATVYTKQLLVCYAHENLHDIFKSMHIQCAWNPLWKSVSLWLSKSFGRYANI